MKHRVFVDGQEGTTGLRIHEYLAARDDIEVLRIAPELRKDAAERARLLNAADVAFLCLPDAASREAAALITNPLKPFHSDHWIETTPTLEGPQGRLRRERTYRLERDLARITALTVGLVGLYFVLNWVLLNSP
jgi:hypothetical protein